MRGVKIKNGTLFSHAFIGLIFSVAKVPFSLSPLTFTVCIGSYHEIGICVSHCSCIKIKLFVTL